MEDGGSRKGERVAVKVELEAFPLQGAAPIPPCRLQSIAITRGTEVGSFILYIGTESGHLLRYVLSSPIVQDSSSCNSPSQTPVQPYSPQPLAPIPSLSLPPSPPPVTVPVGNISSISLRQSFTRDSLLPALSSSHSNIVSTSSPVDHPFVSSPAVASLSPAFLTKPSGRHRNGMPSQQFSPNSPIRQSQHLHSPLSAHPGNSSVPIPSPSSSRGSRQHPSSHSQFSYSELINQQAASLPSSPASTGIPLNSSALSFSPPGNSVLRGDHENGSAQTGQLQDLFANSPSTRPNSPFSSNSVFLDQRVVKSKTGVEMVLTVCKHVSKSPIETLCPLRDCGRIAILSDGHVALLNWNTLNILDRLPGTKGAVTMARGLQSTLPIPYRSSFMVLKAPPEQGSRALVARNDSMNKLFGRGRFSSRLGGLVGGLDKAFAAGKSDVESRRNGRPGRMGNVTGSTKSHMDRLGGVSGFQDALVNGKTIGRLAVAVKKKIVLFEIKPSESEKSEDSLNWSTDMDDHNGFYALKVREVTGIEGVVTMAWLGDVIIAGTRHEYLLFSLTSGLPTHLFSLPQELPWHPLLKAFPKNREALLLIDNAGIPINTEGHPSGGSLLFQILPDGIGSSPPYVLVAKQGAVEVYHHRTGSKLQSLLLNDAGKGRSLVADDDDGAFVVIANSFKVWCLRQVPLDEQLKELLKHKSFKDAERLAEEGQADSSGDSTKARLAVVHAEAGFLLLFDLHFEEAVDHFLQSDIMEPSELFPFFPSWTSRWRAMIPRKRYWGLHPPPQSMRMVIEFGLLAIQSGLLEKSQETEGPEPEELFVGLKSGKDALVERYLRKAMEHVARYLRIIREKRDLKAFEKDGVDTLLMKLYSELDASSELEELAASPNNCVLEEVESLLRGAGQLRTLALLYESKGMWSLALQVWQTLANEPSSPARSGVATQQVGQLQPEQAVAVTEAVRLLEQSSDTDLVLQHINWITLLDENLALNVLTSSKRPDPLSPDDILLGLESEGGMVQQRYLLWLVQEQGFEDGFYHTELALSLAKSAVSCIESSPNGDKSKKPSTYMDSGEQSHTHTQHLSTQGMTSAMSSLKHGNPRDILLTFLETSDHYDAKTVLDVIEESTLWKEQFILHRKLGDEISALRTLALKLEDSEAAERYCAEIGRPEVYLELMDMYLHPGEGREPMHHAAVRLLHCHGSSLDPLQILEALSLEMPLASASETIAQMLVARVHRRRQGQIVRQLLRKDNLEARISRVDERSRHVYITADSTCGSCGARLGTKLLFALYPDDSVCCYKCLRRLGENARPVTHRKSDKALVVIP